MTTLDVVPKKNKPEPSAEETAAKELVRAAGERLSLTGAGWAAEAVHQERARDGVE